MLPFVCSDHVIARLHRIVQSYHVQSNVISIYFSRPTLLKNYNLSASRFVFPRNWIILSIFCAKSHDESFWKNFWCFQEVESNHNLIQGKIKFDLGILLKKVTHHSGKIPKRNY